MPRRIEDVYQDLTGPISLAGHPELLRLAQSVCTKIMRRAFLDDAKLRFQPGWYEDSSFSHPMLMAAQRIDILHRVCYHYRQRPQGAITRSVSPRHFEVFDQYERVFAIVDHADGRYDAFRPELFRLMINHYLVVTTIACHPGCGARSSAGSSRTTGGGSLSAAIPCPAASPATSIAW